jgi:hydroxymethylpyrimidine pyrophosphatase-like HAD family hydrolase
MITSSFAALACDYDGTLATHGVVDDATIASLERCKAAGTKLLLVTGREMDDIWRILPEWKLFDRIVAENGALLYRPATGEEQPLAARPSDAFIQLLRDQDVAPLAVGRVIVATFESYERQVLSAIHQLGLELQLIFNKGSLMILPTGINKASGLAVAVDELGVPPRKTIAVGDAENDHAFLKASGLAVAVANALPALRDAADLVTGGTHGAGVCELIDHLLGGTFPQHALDAAQQRWEQSAALQPAAQSSQPPQAIKPPA